MKRSNKLLIIYILLCLVFLIIFSISFLIEFTPTLDQIRESESIILNESLNK